MQNREAAADQGSQAAPSNTDSESQRLRNEVAAHFAAIVDSSDDAIVSKTLDGIVRTWNAAAERIFGYKPEEIIGQSINLLIPLDRRNEEVEIIKRLQRGERVDHFDTVRVTKTGEPIDISVTVSPIRDKTGQVIGASKIARDITAQKRIQRELRAAKELAESASKAKDLFLSILSHELRTPLTPVLASLSFLESRIDLPETLRAEVGMVRHNVETEVRLVDDLLDLTRISRGTLRLTMEVMDAHSAVRNALMIMHGEIEARQLRVVIALDAEHHHVQADPGRLQQIFLNLLSNSIKFTPPGGTVIARSSNAGSQLRIEIQDTGIGIPADVMPRLFVPFEQGSQSPGTGGIAGLGLGLSISQSLIEMHNGTITAASRGRGQGATFSIEMATVPTPSKRPIPSATSPGTTFTARVLLVEDHDDTRRVMDRLLSSFGCRVMAVATVAQALALADTEEFDLLISDIGLPDGTGNDIMRHLRQRMDVKGIALSGFGQADDLRRSHEAGFDEHLVKPINFQTLRKTLEKLVGTSLE